MAESRLLLPFVTDDPVFTLGFECGQIWELLSNGKKIEHKPCHIENKKQIKMICEALNCKYSIKNMGYGWFDFCAYPITADSIISNNPQCLSKISQQ